MLLKFRQLLLTVHSQYWNPICLGGKHIGGFCRTIVILEQALFYNVRRRARAWAPSAKRKKDRSSQSVLRNPLTNATPRVVHVASVRVPLNDLADVNVHLSLDPLSSSFTHRRSSNARLWSERSTRTAFKMFGAMSIRKKREAAVSPPTVGHKSTALPCFRSAENLDVS